MPAVHFSSYEAWEAITYRVREDKVVVGFREQAKAVCAGINAVIERSLREGISLVIEGVHIAPEFIETSPHVIMVNMYLDNPETHKARFISRASATHVRRDAQQYIDSLDAIIRIQEYLKESADEKDIPSIENKEFEKTSAAILGIATRKMKALLK
jgi:2-phosphoglycerate kinase